MDFLPYELIELQLETLNNLESLFPLKNEFTLVSKNINLLFSSNSSNYLVALQTSSMTSTDFNLSISLDYEPPSSSIPSIPIEPYSIELSISLPLQSPSSSSSSLLLHPPNPIIYLRHSPWLSRKSHSELSNLLVEEYNLHTNSTSTSFVDDNSEPPIDSTSLLLLLIDFLKTSSLPFLILHLTPPPPPPSSTNSNLIRAWYYFPSLSTKEKRDDLINWSSDYGLTGFVLAGKPGLMCLEGEELEIDLFMKRIKNVSWADIPSYQKKVSERHRTLLSSPSPSSSSSPSSLPTSTNSPSENRKFTSMKEITSLINQSGYKNNKSDMTQVRDYLNSFGLGDVFGLVVGGGDF